MLSRMILATGLNRPARAVELLREALRRDPAHPQANMIRDTLRRLSGAGPAVPGAPR